VNHATQEATIFWTWTDEAPALATLSLLPIVQAFTKGTGIAIALSDISLAGRILASFPDYLTEAQRIPDSLAQLGALTLKPEANILKLPNISASLPQLLDAIRELQAQGFPVPDYPGVPQTDAEKDIKKRYDHVLGSAVNPVLSEGNSDRRLPASVKNFGKSHPQRLGVWSRDSRTHVATMSEGDFYGSERAITVAAPTRVRYEFLAADGTVTALKQGMALQEGDILDAAVMKAAALRAFYREQMEEARRQNVLFSLHIKATMMKVSDPVIFGHAVSIYFEPVFQKHADLFRKLGIQADHGLADLYVKIQDLIL